MRVKERSVAPTEKTQRHVGMLFPKEPKKVSKAHSSTGMDSAGSPGSYLGINRMHH